MNPKSLPVALVGTLTIAVGTALFVAAIYLPEWTESSFPSMTRQTTGLFEICEDDGGCSEIDDKSDDLLLVTGLSLGSGVSALLAFVTAVFMLALARTKSINKCLELLPWITMLWSLVSGGAAIAALVVFEDRVYESDEFNRLGLSFVLLAAGGAFAVIGGILVGVGGQYVLAYLKRLEAKDPEYYTAN